MSVYFNTIVGFKFSRNLFIILNYKIQNRSSQSAEINSLKLQCMSVFSSLSTQTETPNVYIHLRDTQNPHFYSIIRSLISK